MFIINGVEELVKIVGEMVFIVGNCYEFQRKIGVFVCYVLF